ncbi:hypothetical protein HDU93_004888, partial [Gonapodya sp. JEL0774]
IDLMLETNRIEVVAGVREVVAQEVAKERAERGVDAVEVEVVQVARRGEVPRGVVERVVEVEVEERGRREMTGMRAREMMAGHTANSLPHRHARLPSLFAHPPATLATTRASCESRLDATLAELGVTADRVYVEWGRNGGVEGCVEGVERGMEKGGGNEKGEVWEVVRKWAEEVVEGQAMVEWEKERVGEERGLEGLPPLPRAGRGPTQQLPTQTSATPTTAVPTTPTTPGHYPDGILKHSPDRISSTTSRKRPQGLKVLIPGASPPGSVPVSATVARRMSLPAHQVIQPGRMGDQWRGNARWAGAGSSNGIAGVVGGKTGSWEGGGASGRAPFSWGNRHPRPASPPTPISTTTVTAPSSPAKSTAPSSPAKSLSSPTRTLQFKFPAVLNRLIGGGGTGKKQEREDTPTVVNAPAASAGQKQAAMSAGAKTTLTKGGPPAASGTGKRLSTLEESEEGDEDDEEDDETNEESEGSSGSGSEETDDYEDESEEDDDSEYERRPTPIVGAKTSTPAITVTASSSPPKSPGTSLPVMSGGTVKAAGSVATTATGSGNRTGTLGAEAATAVAAATALTKPPSGSSTNSPSPPKPAPQSTLKSISNAKDTQRNSNEGSDISSVRSSDLDIDDTEPITAPASGQLSDPQPKPVPVATVVVHQKPASMQQANYGKQPGVAPAASGTGKSVVDDDDSFDISGLSLSDEIKPGAQEQISRPPPPAKSAAMVTKTPVSQDDELDDLLEEFSDIEDLEM